MDTTISSCLFSISTNLLHDVVYWNDLSTKIMKMSNCPFLQSDVDQMSNWCWTKNKFYEPNAEFNKQRIYRGIIYVQSVILMKCSTCMLFLVPFFFLRNIHQKLSACSQGNHTNNEFNAFRLIDIKKTP